MPLSDLRRAGHAPSLVAALVHFDVSFMAWVLLGALGAYVSEDLGLSAFQSGLMVAVPLLAAAAFRVVLGILGDRVGPKRVGTVAMVVVLLPLLWGALGATSYPTVLGMGLLLGVAGASFAISLPLASRWYPPHLQGLAMGIAGAGNSGTVIATLAAPRLAEAYGWHAVFALAMAPVALALVAFVLLAKEPPAPARPLTAAVLRATMREPDAWCLCGLYAVTFGGFVGLASFLPILLNDQYGLSKVDAATVTAAGAAVGSLLRPLGGHLADRLGGTTVLTAVLGMVSAGLLFLAGLPPAAAAALAFVAVMAALGVGNGAVFQLVGLRFAQRIGLLAGVVGAAGGVGGFLLPTLLGGLRDLTGSYGAGLAVLGVVALGALAGTLATRGAWRRDWTTTAEVRI
jgi:NNP family nitrate/nitrite transporter-like MFS transporter